MKRKTKDKPKYIHYPMKLDDDYIERVAEEYLGDKESSVPFYIFLEGKASVRNAVTGWRLTHQ